MKLQSRNSITDQIYGYLIDRIQSGEIEPGQRLIESDLAVYLGVSRTPVRETFRRLEQDGMVERLPQGGTRVTKLNEKTIAEITRIRSLLESYAVEMVCAKITLNDIERLEDIRGQAFAVIDSNKMDKEEKAKRLFELNTIFHDKVYDIADSRYLSKMINNLRLMILRLRAIAVQEDTTWQEVWIEHTNLIAYLKQGEKKKASQLMKRHIQRAASHTMSQLTKPEGPSMKENTRIRRLMNFGSH